MGTTAFIDRLGEDARALLRRLSFEPTNDIRGIAKLMQWPEEKTYAAAEELVQAELGVGSYFEGGDGEIVALRLSDRGRLVARGHEDLAATLS